MSSKTFVCRFGREATADIATRDPVLAAALDHEKAEPVIRCALLMAVSALAEGGRWPRDLLESMAGFMSGMKRDLVQRLH